VGGTYSPALVRREVVMDWGREAVERQCGRTCNDARQSDLPQHGTIFIHHHDVIATADAVCDQVAEGFVLHRQLGNGVQVCRHQTNIR
jgi:hypothetical protein